MERKLTDYLPHGVRAYAELRGLLEAEQEEFEGAWAAAEELLREQFLTEAESYGLDRREELLGVLTLGTEGIAARRGYLLARLNEYLPFTLGRLREMVAALCGQGGCRLTLNGFDLRAEVALESQHLFLAVKELLERVTPLNLRISIVQCYQKYETLHRFTHGELAAFRHLGIQREVLKNGNKNDELRL